MLPREQGGVVDTDLRVYGLANVRVVDASVFPMQFAAHVSISLLVFPHVALNMFTLTIGTAHGTNLRSRRAGS